MGCVCVMHFSCLKDLREQFFPPTHLLSVVVHIANLFAQLARYPLPFFFSFPSSCCTLSIVQKSFLGGVRDPFILSPSPPLLPQWVVCDDIMNWPSSDQQNFIFFFTVPT